MTLAESLVATKQPYQVSGHRWSVETSKAHDSSDENTSEQAKAHAREVLEAAGYTVERDPDVSEDEHEKRVLAGYKAALHSECIACVYRIFFGSNFEPDPRVSAEAKQHAKQYLEQYGGI